MKPQDDAETKKPLVFISYSHRDEIWKDRLLTQLSVLEQQGTIVTWHDHRIEPGIDWYDKINKIIKQAEVAICLISAHYLSSDFCVREEIPNLLERQEREGMILIPVLLSPCPWEEVPWLRSRQMLPHDGKSLSIDFQHSWDTVFAEVARRISRRFRDPDYRLAVRESKFTPPENCDIDRLPYTGQELFGRREELRLLDNAWNENTINVVSLVAWGGVGKSTLVNKWLEGMKADNYRGAKTVFGWSFYSQGVCERTTSADRFIAEALAFFGGHESEQGSPWDKGEHLADLVRKQRSLLLLDGLEPLQAGRDTERGEIKDPALAMLVYGLAQRNNGLCIITTRQPIAKLEDYSNALRMDLSQMQPEAGRALLKAGGAKGTDAELGRVCKPQSQRRIAPITIIARSLTARFS